MNRAGITLLIAAIVLSGCVGNRTAGPPPADCYYLNPDKDLSSIGRVAIVELDNYSHYSQISADVTNAVFQELQKKQVFSLAVIAQDDPVWRSLQLDLNSTYRLEELSEIRKTMNCSAVLTGSVTEFRPYPHMAIGLRLKLLDLKDGGLLWAVEQIWDSADKKTAERIRSYSRYQMQSGSSGSRPHLVAASPLGFINFVAYEVGKTLSKNRLRRDGLPAVQAGG
jgi:hypothetical protein